MYSTRTKALSRLSANDPSIEALYVTPVVHWEYFSKLPDRRRSLLIKPPRMDLLLAALLGNAHLQHLHLIKPSLSRYDVRLLADFLAHNTSLSSFSLLLCRLPPSSAAALARAVAANAHLSRVDLGWTALGTRGALALAQSLASNASLASLALWHNDIPTEGAVALAGALRSNAALTALDLGVNPVGPEAAVAFAAMLGANTTLRSLVLSNAALQDAGAAALAEALRDSPALTLLDLSSNGIAGPGGKALGAALRQNTVLRELTLSWNALTDDCGAVIGEALSVNTTLRSLELRHNLLTQIPISVTHNATLASFTLQGNPLVDPHGDFVESATPSQLRAYLLAKKTRLSRVKLLFVGKHCTGKTTLSYGLTHRSRSLAELHATMDAELGEHAMASTHGIKIRSWPIDPPPPPAAPRASQFNPRMRPPVLLADLDPDAPFQFQFNPPETPKHLVFNIFDFAGQPAYYSNHRNFLSQSQAVYLVVFRADEPQEDAKGYVYHWINLIAGQIDETHRRQIAAQQKPKPAVVFVATHADRPECKTATAASASLCDRHQAWFDSLIARHQYDDVLAFHPELTFIDYDKPAILDRLIEILTELGHGQVSESKDTMLSVFEKLFPYFDAHRKAERPKALFYGLDRLRKMLIHMNPSEAESIDGIGIVGLAKTLQSMGELVYLHELQRVCIEPQRLFDIIAEFVQNSDDMQGPRNDHKKEFIVKHASGCVELRDIKNICLKYNCIRRKSGSAKPLVDPNSLIQALIQLRMCVELPSPLGTQKKHTQYFFPSLVGDVATDPIFNRFFQHSQRECCFDLQWQFSERYSPCTSSPLEVASNSLIYSIQLSLFKYPQFHPIQCWSDAVHVMHLPHLEALIVFFRRSKSIGIRLTVKPLNQEVTNSEPVPLSHDFLVSFDQLVESIMSNISRPIYQGFHLVALCNECTGMFIRPHYHFNQNLLDSPDQGHLVVVHDRQPRTHIFLNPLRRITKLYEETIPSISCCDRSIFISNPPESCIFHHPSFVVSPPEAPSPSLEILPFPPAPVFDLFLCHRGSDHLYHENVKQQYAIHLHKFLTAAELKVFFDIDALEDVPTFKGVTSSILRSRIGLVLFSEGFISAIVEDRSAWCILELRIRYAMQRYIHNRKNIDGSEYSLVHYKTSSYGISIPPFSVERLIHSNLKVPQIDRVRLGLPESDWTMFLNELPQELRNYMFEEFTINQIPTYFPTIQFDEANPETFCQSLLIKLNKLLDRPAVTSFPRCPFPSPSSSASSSTQPLISSSSPSLSSSSSFSGLSSSSSPVLSASSSSSSLSNSTSSSSLSNSTVSEAEEEEEELGQSNSISHRLLFYSLDFMKHLFFEK